MIEGGKCGTCANLEYASTFLEGGIEMAYPYCQHRDGVSADDAACEMYAARDGKAAREAVRDPDMDEHVPAEARWWRCQACGASYVMERGVRPLHCPMCGVRYVWPEFQVRAEEGEE